VSGRPGKWFSKTTGNGSLKRQEMMISCDMTELVVIGACNAHIGAAINKTTQELLTLCENLKCSFVL
jgi:hypothetical protein